MPLASAAFTADVLMSVVSTDASAIPPCARANGIAISPGLSCAPDTIAAERVENAMLALRARPCGGETPLPRLAPCSAPAGR